MEAIVKERRALNAQLAQLIADGHQGKFILFKDGQVVGYHASVEAAYEAGLQRFGSDAVFLATVVRPAPVDAPSLSWQFGVMLVTEA